MSYMNFERGAGNGLAVAFILLAIIGVAVPQFLGLQHLVILALYGSVPLVASTVFYASQRKRRYDYPSLRGTAFRTTVALFLIGLGVSFVLLGSAPVRPFAYYVVIALLATIVFIQILGTGSMTHRSPVILAEISVLLLNVVWGVTFKYHYFFGRTDVFPHAWYVEQVLTTHRVTDTLGIYEFHPLWHVLGAIEIGVLDIPVEPRFALFFTSGIAFVFAILGVYVFAREVLDSEFIALTSALVTAMSTFVIMYAQYSISRSIVSMLLVLLILAVIRHGYRYLVLLTLVTLGIIAYHPVSTPFIIIILGVFYVFQFGFLNHPILRLRELVLITGLQLVYWAIYAVQTLRTFTEVLSRPDPTGGGGEIAFNAVPEVLNYLSFSVLILFIAYGALVALSDHELPSIGRAVTFSGLILVGVTFPGPLQLFNVGESFNLLRFGQYTYPLISIAAATGIVAFARARPSERFGVQLVPVGLVIVLVFSMSFFAVSNDFTASDNPMIERDSFYTFYLTEAEEAGFTTLAATTDGLVYGDHITCKYLNNGPHAGNCHIVEADLESGTFLAHSSDDVFIVRTTELDRRPIKVYDSQTFQLRPTYSRTLQYVENDHLLWNDLATRNRIYASEDVMGYASGNGAEDQTADEA